MIQEVKAKQRKYDQEHQRVVVIHGVNTNPPQLITATNSLPQVSTRLQLDNTTMTNHTIESPPLAGIYYSMKLEQND